MISLARPDDATVRDTLARAADRPLSYSSPGMTKGPPPPGWPVNRIRVPLGRGPDTWREAAAALAGWKQYATSWTRLTPAAPPLAAGATFAVVARHLAFWSVNCCRVVYGPEDDTSDAVVACAIGTLPVHSETGEERFSVERDAKEIVWFDLVAYARPRHPLGRLAPAIVAAIQRRFARDAAAAMRRSAGSGVEVG